jgi:hypothetical protein
MQIGCICAENQCHSKWSQVKTKRDLLFERYLKHPMDTRLAIEIKAIDDQIAEQTKQMERKTGARN